MYATIFQSLVESPHGNNLNYFKQSSDSVQQIVYIPTQNGVIGYTRRVLGSKQRGISGAWVELSQNHMTVSGGVVLGRPVSLAITPADDRQYESEGKYTTLLQKLVRAVESQNKVSGRSTSEVSSEVLSIATHTPLDLVKYTKSLGSILLVREENPPMPQPIAVEPVLQVAEPAPQTSAFLAPESPRQTSAEINRRYAPLSVPPVNPAYIDRTFDGVPLFEVYDKSRRSSRSVLATGDAGTGKSISVEQYAAFAKLPYVVIECSIELTTDITQGRLLPTPLANGNTSWDWHYSELATAITRPSVILLNEFSRQPAHNAPLWLGLLNERKLRIPMLNEVIDVHPEVLFVADQNLGSDYSGAQKQDSALYDRFNPKLEFEVDALIESQLIPSATLLEFANALRYVNKTERAKLRTRVGLRMLLSFVRDVQDFNLKFAVSSFVNNFSEAERSVVRMQFDTRYDAIASELGVDPSTYTPSQSL